MPPPVQPALINPFFTAEDLASINEFNTGFSTQLANIDFDLSNLETDTAFQKKGVDAGAKKATASTQDDAAARGIFQSSIKDAAVYDIEATRSLQQKFLDDKLTAGRLDAGTRKGILATSKENFDKAMATRQADNARAANDANAASWAEAMAAFQASNPQVNPATGAPLKGVSRPATPAPAKGVKRHSAADSNRAAYNAQQRHTQQAAAAAVRRGRR